MRSTDKEYKEQAVAGWLGGVDMMCVGVCMCDPVMPHARISIRKETRDRKHTMTDTHASDKLLQLRLIKNITDHAVALDLVQTALVSTGNNTGSILFIVQSILQWSDTL